MADSPSNIPDAASRFFDNYLLCLKKASIPEKQRRWYVKRVEDFIKAQNGHKIKSISVDAITQYFEAIGRQNHLAGWQFRQCVDAIRILYSDLLTSPICGEVNWRYWKDSARQQDVDHSTTAPQLKLLTTFPVPEQVAVSDYDNGRYLLVT